MAHGNKTMPLDRYPYFDNDLKSKVGDFVTHEELENAINGLTTAMQTLVDTLTEQINTNAGHIEDINTEIVKRLGTDRHFGYNDFNSLFKEIFSGVTISGTADIINNILIIAMTITFDSPLTPGGYADIAYLSDEIKHNQLYPHTGGGSGVKGGIIINSSGKISVRNFTTSSQSEMLFNIVYIMDDSD